MTPSPSDEGGGTAGDEGREQKEMKDKRINKKYILYLSLSQRC
jgi:hypothetical protein